MRSEGIKDGLMKSRFLVSRALGAQKTKRNPALAPVGPLAGFSLYWCGFKN